MSEIPTVTIPLTELIRLRQDSFELEQLRRLIYRGFFSSASNTSCEDINRIFNGRDSVWRDLVDDYHDTIEKGSFLFGIIYLYCYVELMKVNNEQI